MKRGEISVSEKKIMIAPVDGTVWLSAWEIAKIFEVFPAKVTSNIRSILKSGVFWIDDVCYCHHYANGGCVDLYNLEMITALAFRINSPKAELFRKWLMRKAVEVEAKTSPTVLFYNATLELTS